MKTAVHEANSTPSAVKKYNLWLITGGKHTRYVPNSDNKYVQYRLMDDTWSTTVSDWQGVDDEPITDSNNLVKSSGVFNADLNQKGRVTIQAITEFSNSLDKESNVYKSGVYIYGQQLAANPRFSNSDTNILFVNSTVKSIIYCFVDITNIGMPGNYRTIAIFNSDDELIYEGSDQGKVMVSLPRGCKLLARATDIYYSNNYDNSLGAYNIKAVFEPYYKLGVFNFEYIGKGIAKNYVQSTQTGIFRRLDGINATPVSNNTKYFKLKNETGGAYSIVFKSNRVIGTPQNFRNYAIYDENDTLIYTAHIQGYIYTFLPPGYTIIANADNYMYTSDINGLWRENISNAKSSYYILPNTIIAWGADNYITNNANYSTIVLRIKEDAKTLLYSGIDYSNMEGNILFLSDVPDSNYATDYVLKNQGAVNNKIYEIPDGCKYALIPFGITDNPNIESNFTYSFNAGNVVKCIGDSLTQSVVNGIASIWETYLTSLYSQYYDFYNYGAGGENVGTIFARTGLLPMQIASDISIPATSQRVQITIKNVYNQILLPFIQGELRNGAQVIINGIQGLMQGEMSGIHTANYYFTRNTDGDAVTFKENDEIFVVSTKSIRNGNDCAIIWVGQNGGYSINETSRYQGDPTDPNDVNRLVGMIKSAISVMNPQKYIVVSPPENTAELLENSFMMAFGGGYLNVRQYLVNRGIDIAKNNGWLDSSYPTAQDIEDMTNGIVPTSLRQDSVHFNEIGYKVFALGIKEMIDNQW